MGPGTRRGSNHPLHNRLRLAQVGRVQSGPQLHAMNSMATDDGHASSATIWDSDEHSRLRVSPNQVVELHQASPHNPSISPLPRSSTDSEGRSAFLTPFNEGNSLERRDTLATIHSVEQPSLVEPGFDENVLRQLCDLDVRQASYLILTALIFSFLQCSVPLLLDRIKQSVVSCRVSVH